MKLPSKLKKKLERRQDENSLRRLGSKLNLVDFSSNDYLGLAKSALIGNKVNTILQKESLTGNGATGSRLLSGNYPLYNLTEKLVSGFHNSEAALIFNSGYDANVGFFSSVPQRGDFILYDELIHASIRDGISMSRAKAFKFRHNDIAHIKALVERHSGNEEAKIYIVTESVFSMDGDVPDLSAITELASNNGCLLVIDEAHATGIFGENGGGIVQELGLEEKIFARVHTFGKALGCHGAAILGSQSLVDYLLNFARSFIYTTGLPPHSVGTILAVYRELQDSSELKAETEKLKENIEFFRREILSSQLQNHFIGSTSAIHSCIVPGNERVKKIAARIMEAGFDVKPILSPTVPQGRERLRFCLHSYNSSVEIKEVLNLLAIFIKKEQDLVQKL